MSTCCATQRRVSHVVRRFLLAGSVVICAVLLAVAARPVAAQDTFQFNQGGDPANPQEWNDALNWLDLTNPANNGMLPGSLDNVDLNNFMTAKIDQSTFSGTYNRVYVGADAQQTPNTTGDGVLNHSAGVLSTAGGGSWFRIGQGANGGIGTYNMSGTADLEQTNDTLRIGENGTGIMTMTDNSILNSTGLNIADHGTGTFTISGNAVATVPNLNLADNGGTATLNIHGNAVINSLSGDANFGTSNGGTATVNQDGGTVNLETDNQNWSAVGRDGGHGVYNLSGGLVNSQHWLLVGRGNTASNGTFNISGTGVLSTRSLWVGQDHSTGVVNQIGGTVNVGPAYAGGANDSGNFRVGFDNGNGTYNMMGGVLNDLSGAFNGVTMKSQIQSLDINDGNGSAPIASGIFNQTGGTVNANWIRNGNGMGTAQYNITGTVASPSVLNAARIMAGTNGSGSGVYNQTTANTTVNVDNDVSIGDSGGTGVYNISAGVLNAGLTSPYGEGGGASGTGTATGNEVMQIGWNATGTVNQTGGIVNALNTPIAAPTAGIVQGTSISGIGFNGNNSASGVGVYNLSGGTLNVAAIFKVNDGGTGTFNFNGGTLRVNAGPTTALPIFMGSGNPDIVNNNNTPPSHTLIEALTAANVQAGGAIIDVNSFGITISQPLLNGVAGTDGGLTLKDTSVGGGGSLTLTGADTFTGPTNIVAGAAGPTLFVGNTLALQNSTVNVGVTPANSVQFTSGLGSATFGSLAGAGNLSLNDTGAAAVSLTAGGNNSTTAYSGVMSGLGSFTKTGTGMMTLGTSQTYSGTTRVNGGGLVINGISLPNTSAVTVGGATAVPGSSPTLIGAGTIANGLTVNGAGGTGDAGHVSPHFGRRDRHVECRFSYAQRRLDPRFEYGRGGQSGHVRLDRQCRHPDLADIRKRHGEPHEPGWFWHWDVQNYFRIEHTQLHGYELQHQRRNLGIPRVIQQRLWCYVRKGN